MGNWVQMKLYNRQRLDCNYLIALADGVYGSTEATACEAIRHKLKSAVAAIADTAPISKKLIQ